MNKFSFTTKIRNFLSAIKYEPNSYWNERGKNLDREDLYNKEKYRKQERMLIEHLKGIKFSSVLELGCGYGRITKLILENFQVSRYVAIDISSVLIEKAKNKIPDKVEFQVNDINNISKEEKFDLVLASEVLMHIKPNNIERIIRNIISISNNHIINIDWYERPNPKIRFGHNFIHDYTKFYKANKDIMKVTEIEIPIEPPSVLFHAVKNKGGE